MILQCLGPVPRVFLLLWTIKIINSDAEHHDLASRVLVFLQEFCGMIHMGMSNTLWAECRHGYFNRSSFSFDFLGGFLFTWTVMVLHDAYFFTVHTLMHKFKLAYRRIHQWHHVTNGDLTVYSTAFGDVLDIAFTFTPFYACLLLYVFLQPSWDLLHMLMLGWAVYCVNMMGHSGYKLPAWIYVPASSGVLLTPYAQRPRHHYIHHLDPRYNRSLYFTWCDRLTGTFREHHPKVLEDDESSCDNKSLNNNNYNYKSKKSSDDNNDHCKDFKSLMMDPMETNFTFTELLLPSALILKFYRGNHHA